MSDLAQVSSVPTHIAEAAANAVELTPAAARITALETALAEAEGRVIAAAAWIKADLIDEYGERTAQEQVAWHYATALETGEWKKDSPSPPPVV